MELVREVRARDASVLSGLPGTRLLLGGLAAGDVQNQDAIGGNFPAVVAIVIGGTLIALMIGFRSVLVPIKAVALNLLSVGAAFGAAVLVFQDGYARASSGWRIRSAVSNRPCR
jgi:RND superfamily putative drug exporter